MYIFISHSSTDGEIAKTVCDTLDANRFETFLSSRDIKGGAMYAEELIDALDRSDALLLLLSRKADASPHVLREVERACSKNIPIVVYKLEDFPLSKAMEYFIMTHQWVARKPHDDLRELVSVMNNLDSRKKDGAALTIGGSSENTLAESVKKTGGSMTKSIIIAACIVGACLIVGSVLLVCFRGKGESDDNGIQKLANASWENSGADGSAQYTDKAAGDSTQGMAEGGTETAVPTDNNDGNDISQNVAGGTGADSAQATADGATAGGSQSPADGTGAGDAQAAATENTANGAQTANGVAVTDDTQGMAAGGTETAVSTDNNDGNAIAQNVAGGNGADSTQNAADGATAGGSQSPADGTGAGDVQNTADGATAGGSQSPADGTGAGDVQNTADGGAAGGSQSLADGTGAGAEQNTADGAAAGGSQSLADGTGADSAQNTADGGAAGGSQSLADGTGAGDVQNTADGAAAGGSQNSSGGTGADSAQNTADGAAAGGSQSPAGGTGAGDVQNTADGAAAGGSQSPAGGTGAAAGQGNNTGSSSAGNETAEPEKSLGSRLLDGKEIGDSITFGEYLGKPIEWRVLHFNDDGTVILIAKDILTMKCFDSAESGTYNSCPGDDRDLYMTATSDMDYSTQLLARGDNCWAKSNIRAWLNSSEEVVSYSGSKPTSASSADMKSGYVNEKGFLYYFSKEERSALVPYSFTSRDCYGEKTRCSDKVFLLSEKELSWFDEGGLSIYAKPTGEAVQADKSEWYTKLSVGEYWPWWLRDSEAGTACKCRIVGYRAEGQRVYSEIVGLEGYGIRPAICLKK